MDVVRLPYEQIPAEDIFQEQIDGVRYEVVCGPRGALRWFRDGFELLRDPRETASIPVTHWITADPSLTFVKNRDGGRRWFKNDQELKSAIPSATLQADPTKDLVGSFVSEQVELEQGSLPDHDISGFLEPVIRYESPQRRPHHDAVKYVLDYKRVQDCKREVGRLARANVLTPASSYAEGSTLFYLAGHTTRKLPNNVGLSARDLYVGFRLYAPPHKTIKNIDEATFRSHLELWASANSMLHTVRNGQIEHVFDIELRKHPLSYEGTQIFMEGLGSGR